MHVTLIDGSHKDRPHLNITASEVISCAANMGEFGGQEWIHLNKERSN